MLHSGRHVGVRVGPASPLGSWTGAHTATGSPGRVQSHRWAAVQGHLSPRSRLDVVALRSRLLVWPAESSRGRPAARTTGEASPAPPATSRLCWRQCLWLDLGSQKPDVQTGTRVGL